MTDEATNSVNGVVRDLLNRFRWSGRREPWSLTELRLSDADLERMRDIFRRLPQSNVRSAFNGFASPLQLGDEQVGGQAVFGLFLLLLFSEIARREASEGTLWAAVRHSVSANPAARDLLFDAGGQPRPEAAEETTLTVPNQSAKTAVAVGLFGGTERRETA